jgi:hypothetical protein
MFGTEFCKKCIIMHFLGAEKDGKSSQRRDTEYAEKRFEEGRETEDGEAGRGWGERRFRTGVRCGWAGPQAEAYAT